MEQFSQKFESRPFSPEQRKSCQNGTRLKQNEMKGMMNELILTWNEIGKNSSLVHACFRVLFSFKLMYFVAAVTGSLSSFVRNYIFLIFCALASVSRYGKMIEYPLSKAAMLFYIF